MSTPADNMIILNREQLRSMIREAVGEGISLTHGMVFAETSEDVDRTVQNILNAHGIIPVADLTND